MSLDPASFALGVFLGGCLGALGLLGFAIFMTRNERRGQR